MCKSCVTRLLVNTVPDSLFPVFVEFCFKYKTFSCLFVTFDVVDWIDRGPGRHHEARRETEQPAVGLARWEKSEHPEPRLRRHALGTHNRSHHRSGNQRKLVVSQLGRTHRPPIEIEGDCRLERTIFRWNWFRWLVGPVLYESVQKHLMLIRSDDFKKLPLPVCFITIVCVWDMYRQLIRQWIMLNMMIIIWIIWFYNKYQHPKLWILIQSALKSWRRKQPVLGGWCFIILLI